ncbi:hypothetical protein [Mammaliicoccus virus vB_MscM-PMS2]|nr:hypothetical protein [Mammaliicoccus virus vB_MscM-PMS2]
MFDENKYRRIIENRRNGITDNDLETVDTELASVKPSKPVSDIGKEKEDINIDKGIYTKETLDKFLFTDELTDYITGIDMFKTKQTKENEIVVAPLSDMDMTFIGISQGNAYEEGFKEAKTMSRSIGEITRYFKPLFYINGIYNKGKNEDLFYYFRNDLKLNNVSDLSEEDKNKLQPTETFGILSPYTMPDIEVLTVKKINKMIDGYLKIYNQDNKEKVNAKIKSLIIYKDAIDKLGSTILYIPLFDKVIACSKL